jgi:hypothetical protein
LTNTEKVREALKALHGPAYIGEDEALDVGLAALDSILAELAEAKERAEKAEAEVLASRSVASLAERDREKAYARIQELEAALRELTSPRPEEIWYVKQVARQALAGDGARK